MAVTVYWRCSTVEHQIWTFFSRYASGPGKNISCRILSRILTKIYPPCHKILRYYRAANTGNVCRYRWPSPWPHNRHRVGRLTAHRKCWWLCSHSDRHTLKRYRFFLKWVIIMSITLNLNMSSYSNWIFLIAVIISTTSESESSSCWLFEPRIKIAICSLPSTVMGAE